MTVGFAIDFIPRRMRELGHGDNYLTRWRNLQIDPLATLKIRADNEYYYLISRNASIMVSSKYGVYDRNNTNLSELQYEHRGFIQVKNQMDSPQFVLFIQVIPHTLQKLSQP